MKPKNKTSDRRKKECFAKIGQSSKDHLSCSDDMETHQLTESYCEDYFLAEKQLRKGHVGVRNFSSMSLVDRQAEQRQKMAEKRRRERNSAKLVLYGCPRKKKQCSSVFTKEDFAQIGKKNVNSLTERIKRIR